MQSLVTATATAAATAHAYVLPPMYPLTTKPSATKGVGVITLQTIPKGDRQIDYGDRHSDLAWLCDS